MTTATKTKKAPTISVDEYAWFTCEHGSYRVVETRFGLYKSIDKDGNEHPLQEGSIVYVNDDEMHCFKNKGSEEH